MVGMGNPFAIESTLQFSWPGRLDAALRISPNRPTGQTDQSTDGQRQKPLVATGHHVRAVHRSRCRETRSREKRVVYRKAFHYIRIMTPRQAAQLKDPLCSDTPRIVLDTNVALDWLVFADPRCSDLARLIVQGRLAWHATQAMRDELAHVLPRPALARWQHDSVQVLATFDEHVRLTTPADCRDAAQLPACKDPDDQKFIDLACAIGARWLLTHDRALLDLAAPARRLGVEILKPHDWRLGGAASTTASCEPMANAGREEIRRS